MCSEPGRLAGVGVRGQGGGAAARADLVGMEVPPSFRSTLCLHCIFINLPVLGPRGTLRGPGLAAAKPDACVASSIHGSISARV